MNSETILTKHIDEYRAKYHPPQPPTETPKTVIGPLLKPHILAAMKEYAELVAGEAWDNAVEWVQAGEVPVVKYGYRTNHVPDKEQFLQSLTDKK